MSLLMWGICYLAAMVVIVIGTKIGWFRDWFIIEDMLGYILPISTFMVILFWPIRILHMLIVYSVTWLAGN